MVLELAGPVPAEEPTDWIGLKPYFGPPLADLSLVLFVTPYVGGIDHVLRPVMVPCYSYLEVGGGGRGPPSAAAWAMIGRGSAVPCAPTSSRLLWGGLEVADLGYIRQGGPDAEDDGYDSSRERRSWRTGLHETQKGR